MNSFHFLFPTYLVDKLVLSLNLCLAVNSTQINLIHKTLKTQYGWFKVLDSTEHKRKHLLLSVVIAREGGEDDSSFTNHMSSYRNGNYCHFVTKVTANLNLISSSKKLTYPDDCQQEKAFQLPMKLIQKLAVKSHLFGGLVALPCA